MRVTLRDGQWAELRERINHGQAKALKRAERDDEFDLQTEVIRQFVTAWDIKDIDGIPIALTDADAVDRLPSGIADELFVAAADAYKANTVPNLPTPDSSGESSSDRK